ncbi:MAG: glycosyltransferase family 1 protein [Ignavibacteriaceae bacterium]|nr:glycosyltransferase family 1 protein [Ignavibacteriaceae bacterium]
MKIAVEATTIGPKITGTNRFLNCLIEQLNYLGNELLYFQPGNKSGLMKYFPDTVQRHYYRQFNLKKEIESSVADCAIFPDYFIPDNFNKPSAVVIHDLSFISHPQFYSNKFVKYYSYKLRKTLIQNPLILTVSNHTKNNIIKYLGIKTDNIYLVQGYSNMRSAQFEHNHVSLNNFPYLLYVGHIEPRKNLIFLVNGFKQWKKRVGVNIKLKIVGELWIKSRELLTLMNDSRNDPDIEFIGYVSDDKLADIYCKASGFVHTSFEEGFGFPVLEAMKFNLPVITTKGIATEEISTPLSIAIDPNYILGYYSALDKMLSYVCNNVRPEYNIKYSPSLMRNQLSGILDILESRIKKSPHFRINRSLTNEEALEKTLVYAAMFNYGIKVDKIHEQLFDRLINKFELDRIIERYKVANLITESNGYFYLNNRVKGFYKKSTARVDKNKLNKLLYFLNKIPFISMIAFSGGTALYGLYNHDDIDLFIITKPYTVYIVYLLIHLYSLLSDSRKELCANYLIDETNLEIKYSHDFYTAHQIITLSPFKNEKMLGHFISKNSWISKFFPNFKIINLDPKTSGKGYIIINPLNLTIMLLYKFLYKNKLDKLKLDGSMVITKNCLKLHSNDNRYKISSEFQKTWNDFLERKENKSKLNKHLVLK